MNDLTTVANERAQQRIDKAIGKLRTAAKDIAKEMGIPADTLGHSPEEILGRIAYVPSLARDLRKALVTAITQMEIRDAMATPAPSAPTPPPVTVTSPATQSVDLTALDIRKVQGISPSVVKLLMSASLYTAADVAGIPDEHLLKVGGMNAKHVAQIRAAIAETIAKAERPPRKHG